VIFLRDNKGDLRRFAALTVWVLKLATIGTWSLIFAIQFTQSCSDRSNFVVPNPFETPIRPTVPVHDQAGRRGLHMLKILHRQRLQSNRRSAFISGEM
jgi:hypothetical protein